MKKILSIILMLIITASFVGCSNSTANETSTENGIASESTTNETTESSNKVDKNIDAVAAFLGYTDGEETYYSTIGATAGKEYDGGNFELYQFDEDAQAYDDIINGNGYLTASAYKDGIVLIFPNGESGDTELIEKFNSIEFK